MIIENRLIYFKRTVAKTLNLWVPLNYSNRVVMHCNKVSFQALVECFDNDLENNACIAFGVGVRPLC